MYTDVITNMWVAVFGNMLIGGVAIIASFIFLIAVQNYKLEESTFVLFPVLFGLVNAAFIPTWVKGLFLFGLGIIWGMALMRIT